MLHNIAWRLAHLAAAVPPELEGVVDEMEIVETMPEVDDKYVVVEAQMRDTHPSFIYVWVIGIAGRPINKAYVLESQQLRPGMRHWAETVMAMAGQWEVDAIITLNDEGLGMALHLFGATTLVLTGSEYLRTIFPQGAGSPLWPTSGMPLSSLGLSQRPEWKSAHDHPGIRKD